MYRTDKEIAEACSLAVDKAVSAFTAERGWVSSSQLIQFIPLVINAYDGVSKETGPSGSVFPHIFIRGVNFESFRLINFYDSLKKACRDRKELIMPSIVFSNCYFQRIDCNSDENSVIETWSLSSCTIEYIEVEDGPLAHRCVFVEGCKIGTLQFSKTASLASLNFSDTEIGSFFAFNTVFQGELVFLRCSIGKKLKLGDVYYGAVIPGMQNYNIILEGCEFVAPSSFYFCRFFSIPILLKNKGLSDCVFDFVDFEGYENSDAQQLLSLRNLRSDVSKSDNYHFTIKLASYEHKVRHLIELQQAKAFSSLWFEKFFFFCL